MRSPWTANDDQPGPIGLRQIATGGLAAQLVSIRVPRSTLPRVEPRKPAHDGRTPTAAGAADAAATAGEAAAGSADAGAPEAGTASGVGVATTPAGASEVFTGASVSLRVCASSRCSAVGVQRHAISDPAPRTPSVRIS